MAERGEANELGETSRVEGVDRPLKVCWNGSRIDSLRICNLVGGIECFRPKCRDVEEVIGWFDYDQRLDLAFE